MWPWEVHTVQHVVDLISGKAARHFRGLLAIGRMLVHWKMIVPRLVYASPNASPLEDQIVYKLLQNAIDPTLN